jgi:hypothetical protein
MAWYRYNSGGGVNLILHLNGIAKAGYGHLCLREENLSLIIDYII